MLDKNIQKFLTEYQAKNYPPYSSFQAAELRKWYNQLFKQKIKPETISIAKIEEGFIPDYKQKIKYRIYYPHTNTANLPAWMYFHGGGFVIRDNMDIYDQTCRMICVGTGSIVIAVDFRLAPEHPFPAAPEDCYAATCWAFTHAKQLGINQNSLGVWGESCGGNLTAVIPIMARDKNGPKIKCQIIITPMLNYNFDTASYIENGNGDYFTDQ